MMNPRFRILGAALALASAAGGCSGGGGNSVTVASVPAPVASAATTKPVATPTPPPVAVPTATPSTKMSPTAAPTAAPTVVPSPTATPSAPPTAVPIPSPTATPTPTPFPSAGPATECLNGNLYTTSFVQQFTDVNSWRANNGTGGQWFTGYQWGRTNGSAGDAAFYIDKSLDLPNTPGYDPFGISGSDQLTIEAQPVGAIPGLSPSQIDNMQYVSGLISTGGQNVNGNPATTFVQRYGYYEVMVQLPGGQGIWPSFWMLDTYTRAEVDVFEFLGQNTSQIYQSIHYFDGSSQSIPYNLGFDATAGLHRYGVLISPAADVYYVDGVPTQSYPDASQNDFYFMVSLQIGGPNSGNFPGPPNSTTPWPAVLYLQYFHAYVPTTTSCSSPALRVRPAKAQPR